MSACTRRWDPLSKSGGALIVYRQSLVDAIKGDTSGNYEKVLVSLCNSNRTEGVTLSE